MLYAVLCYNDENVVSSWTKEEDDACLARLARVQEKMSAAGKLGPVVRLKNTDTATTLRKNDGKPLIVDGPFAETKEQFLGFYVVDCETLEEVHEFAKELAAANPGPGCYEIRPVSIFNQATLDKSAAA